MNTFGNCTTSWTVKVKALKVLLQLHFGIWEMWYFQRSLPSPVSSDLLRAHFSLPLVHQSRVKCQFSHLLAAKLICGELFSFLSSVSLHVKWDDPIRLRGLWQSSKGNIFLMEGVLYFKPSRSFEAHCMILLEGNFQQHDAIPAMLEHAHLWRPCQSFSFSTSLARLFNPRPFSIIVKWEGEQCLFHGAMWGLNAVCIDVC